jgi:hypothetical protein
MPVEAWGIRLETLNRLLNSMCIEQRIREIWELLGGCELYRLRVSRGSLISNSNWAAEDLE